MAEERGPRTKTAPMQKKSKPNRLIIALIVIILIASGFWLFKKYNLDASKNNDHQEQAQPINKSEPPKQKTGKLKTFTAEEFRDIYNNFNYPNTRYIDDDAVITGNPSADEHIQELAEARGYMRRSAPITDSFIKLQNNEFVLQERAATDWLKMQESAKEAGIYLSLNAGYRSASEQRQIFLERLNQNSISISRIASGSYDNAINNVLATTAIPGYSRHHTGYTIDIACDNQPSATFAYTVCFDWLEANNYANAKTYGWIPSYPEGAKDQGPEPESWEYVWVGADTTTE